MPGGPVADQGCHGKLTCNRAVTGCHRLSQAVTGCHTVTGYHGCHSLSQAITAVTGCHMLYHTLSQACACCHRRGRAQLACTCRI